MTSEDRPVPGARRGSMRTQLVVGSVLALTLLLALFGAFVRYTVVTTLIASVDRDLDQRTARIADMPPPPPRPFGDDGGGQGFRPPPPYDDGPPPDQRGDRPPPPRDQPFGPRGGPDANNPYHPRLFDTTGRSIRNQGINTPPWDSNGLEKALQGQAIYSTLNYQGQQLRVLSRPFPSQGPVRGAVQIAYPLARVNDAVAGVNRALLTLIPVALLFAAFGGALLTNRALHRVREMARAAARIGAKDLSQRLPVAGSDEFSELAETFNALLSRVDTAFQEQLRIIEQQRRFTADASHELKTPLTVIRGTTSLALAAGSDGTLDRRSTSDIDRAAAGMSDLVQDLLYLARSDAGQLGRERVELLIMEPLRRAAAGIAPMAEAAIQISADDESLTVVANESEMVRLFSNLLDNAARSTPKGGRISAAVTSTQDSVVVTLSDTGLGVAPEHVQHLTERFYRVDRSRTRDGAGGTGLGLSICQGIVESHGGSLSIESAQGKGTKVTIRLPKKV